MAPSEQSILSQFLLAPAPLPIIITLQQFTALFPSSEQSSPEVKRLYRALQHRRALLTDAVTQDIDDEVKRGIAQKRAVVRTRRAAEREEYDEEVVVENALFGNSSNLPVTKSHSLKSILPDLEKAADDIEAEVQGLKSEVERLLAEIKATVSGLSDLRYGKLANGELKEEVLQGLDGLHRECEKK